MPTVGQPTQLVRSSIKSYPLKIVALGDSLVYGHGDPVGGGWTDRLRRKWMGDLQTGHVLYNLGIRGDRVSQVAERLEGEFRYRGELRNQVPDLIILSVGVNDSPRLGQPNGRPFTDFTIFEQQVGHLLHRAQQLCPVIFVGMVPVDEVKMPFLGCFYFNHFDQYRYKEATKKACNSLNIPYLDIFDLWLERGESWLQSSLSPDGLHPNVVGYKSLLRDIINWQYMSSLITDV
ncbi:GDSL-type esterase/lipase family protein [Cyanobacterium sp. uoEpiScrs1]|uniref:GDSL-type esterase/lipase family protein n=1 Tax=Cyanobacterium sp. uoEpiScrs1 TaxID=2976343 RepID=UPI00226A1A08|nr:GDSL-type esterase/lipase family protein [Cyanobacterium sp. uoEpiScrs1]